MFVFGNVLKMANISASVGRSCLSKIKLLQDAECLGECKKGGVPGGARLRMTKSVTRHTLAGASDGDNAATSRNGLRRIKSTCFIAFKSLNKARQSSSVGMIELKV